jgi:putative endonuclease
MTRRREAAERSGHWGETAAAAHLILTGHTLLARRVRLPMGEIDLIARKGRLVAFVEVKLRADRDDALSAVTLTGWTRIAAAAAFWMAHRPKYADLGWRYDLIAVAPWRWPEHIPDAWRPGMA